MKQFCLFERSNYADIISGDKRSWKNCEINIKLGMFKARLPWKYSKQ